jgi:hypothetical protein
MHTRSACTAGSVVPLDSACTRWQRVVCGAGGVRAAQGKAEAVYAHRRCAHPPAARAHTDSVCTDRQCTHARAAQLHKRDGSLCPPLTSHSSCLVSSYFAPGGEVSQPELDSTVRSLAHAVNHAGRTWRRRAARRKARGPPLGPGRYARSHWWVGRMADGRLPDGTTDRSRVTSCVALKRWARARSMLGGCAAPAGSLLARARTPRQPAGT